MKKVAIVGTGLGRETLTYQALEAIEEAEVLIGSPRLIEIFAGPEKITYSEYTAEKVLEIIDNESAESFAVLVSGDVGFYSAADGMAKALADAHAVSFLPGMSSAQAFFARLKLPWQNACFISAHGRQANVADTVRRNGLTFCLTGNNTGQIGGALDKAGLGHITTYVGQDLGTEKEKIYDCRAADLADGEFSPLTVLIFSNPKADDSIAGGLPDSAFFRLEKIPMTKSEVRAIALSKLAIKPDDTCWDVGAGTGSVAIEMALSAYKGQVYAIEQKLEAISLIEKNATAFHIGNINPLAGKAPGALKDLPAPDVVFVGGSGGLMKEIVEMALEQNPKARLVATAISIETVGLALSAFEEAGLTTEIIQVNIARSRPLAGIHMMEAQNPITIISGSRQEAAVEEDGGRP